MIEKTLYGKHYDRIHALWERAALGYNIRDRWCRRRKKQYPTYISRKQDPIAQSLYRQCEKYYNLLQYLKDNPQ